VSTPRSARVRVSVRGSALTMARASLPESVMAMARESALTMARASASASVWVPGSG
jgi:hypothetical protein